MEQRIFEASCRIRQMESLFDALQAEDARKSPGFFKDLQTLLEYYDGGHWLQDYQLDEQGLLPKDLKRGVLSQDGIYNFLLELNDK